MSHDAGQDRDYRGAAVLITGGAGFIGSHLAEALAVRGANVTVLDNLQAGTWDNLREVAGTVRTAEADVRDPTAVQRVLDEVRPRFLFHLAANASVPGSVEDPAYDFETNCAGTFVVLDALRRTGGCERVVLASSGAVYGQPESFPIREADPLRPISPYGASKVGAEVTAGMFASVYALPVVIARLFNVYGSRMARFVVLDFLRKLRRDPSVLEVLGDGRQVRDFTHVSDTVEGLLLLGRRGEAGEAYNLSSGSSCTVTELAHKLIAALKLVGRTRLVCTGMSWVGDARRWEVSVKKMMGMGYSPRVSLEEGLARTVEWFQRWDR